MKIKNITAREILDSKGDPTIEAQVELENGIKALGQTPSGASTGSSEALELRDHDSKRYQGKGVLKAVANIRGPIKDLLVQKDASKQEAIDQLMIDLDGTDNKSKLGANTIVAVSMAVARVAARAKKLPLYNYLGQLSNNNKFEMPQPMILVMEGGKHGAWATDIQEFMIVPKKDKFSSFALALKAGADVFHQLEKILKAKSYDTGVGFEGAYCPQQIKSNSEAFELIIEAVKKAGYSMPDEIVLAVDAAASEFFTNSKYNLKSEKISFSSKEWTDKIKEWVKKYPLWSLEDMHDEKDWEAWVDLNTQLGQECQIVGDDLLTTNVGKIKKAIDLEAVNSVLIKVNQIGTVTETIKAIKLANKVGFTTVVSHRGGETNDDFIADLVVGSSSDQCKFGGPDRGERLAKYNRLLRIEEELN